MFWKFLYWLCTLPPVYSWLYSRIEKNPYYTIQARDNSEDEYMRRGWVIKRGSWWQKLLRLNFCVRIHHILRPDADPHLHNHPFNYRTIILKGWYNEQRGNRLYGRYIGETVRGYPETFHRIDELAHGGAVTLFIMWGGERGNWGFMTSAGYMKADDYFRMRDFAVYMKDLGERTPEERQEWLYGDFKLHEGFQKGNPHNSYED